MSKVSCGSGREVEDCAYPTQEYLEVRFGPSVKFGWNTVLAVLTWYPNLLERVSKAQRSSGDQMHAPIPMTGPYFSLSSSALTAAGHTRRRAKSARKKRERVDAKRRDCVLVGRRDNRVMAREMRETERGKRRRREREA